jgi:hypothetical protein
MLVTLLFIYILIKGESDDFFLYRNKIKVYTSGVKFYIIKKPFYKQCGYILFTKTPLALKGVLHPCNHDETIIIYSSFVTILLSVDSYSWIGWGELYFAT